MKKLFLFLSLLITTCSAFAQPVTGPNHVCVGSTITLGDASPGGSWVSQFPMYGTITTGSGVFTGVSAGVTMVTYNFSGGGFTTYLVTVNPLPAPITGTLTVCQGNTTSLGDPTAGGSWSSSSPPCGTVNLSGVVTGISAPCSTTISYTLATGCYTTVVVNVLAGPAVHHIYGGGVYCPGSPCPHIYMDSSQVGVNYQVFCGGTPLGSPIAGTGGTIDIGALCTACVYTVVATNVTTGCSAIMSGSVTVTLGALPVVYIVGGGGTHCDTTTCPHITLSGSDIGVTYKLMCSGSVVLTRTGTGAAIDFGAECTNCTYSVVATNDATGCSNTMTGTAVVSSGTPCPITGATVICVGSTSTLSACTGCRWASSTPAVISIDPCSGVVTGNSPGAATISFTSASGCVSTITVSVTATCGACSLLCGNGDFEVPSSVTGSTYYSGGITCWNTTDSTGSGSAIEIWHNMAGFPAYSGSQNIEINARSASTVYTDFTVTSSGTYYISFAHKGRYILPDGMSVWLATAPFTAPTHSNPHPGATALSGTILDNNSAWSYPNTISYTFSPGTYRLFFHSDSWGGGTEAGGNLLDDVAVTRSHPIAGPATVCVGSPVSETDADSCGGTWHSSTPGVATISSSGLVTPLTPGVDTITFTSSCTGCSISKIITVTAPPAVYTVGGGGSHCDTTTCPHITLSNSYVGVTYKVMCGSSVVLTRAGTGAAIDFGTECTNCSYSVVASNDASGCTTTMSGTAVVSSSTPCVITGGTSICVGQTETLSGCSGCGWSSSDPTVATIGSCDHVVTGVGAGVVTLSYANGSCFSTFTITVNPLPVAYTVTGGGLYCTGPCTSCPHVGLSNSQVGVNYQLYCGSTAVPPILAGTGGPLDFGTQCGPCVYTIKATNTATGCTNTMTGSVSSAPIIPCTITGPTSVCVGSDITLSGCSGTCGWSSSSTGTATVGSCSGDVHGVTAGVVTITFTSLSGCISTYTVTVNPVCPIIGLLSVCLGQTIALSSPCTGGIWTSSMPTVATIGGSGSVTPVMTGTTTVTYSSSTGCSNSVVVTVNTVPPTPVITGGPLSICIGGTSTLTGAPGGGNWLLFDFTSGPFGTLSSTTTDPTTFTGTSSGVQNILYIVSNACGNSAAVALVSVNVLPPISGLTSVCVGSNITLTEGTTGNWSSSSTGVATVSPSIGVSTTTVHGVTPGTTTITFTTSAGCSTTWVVSVDSIPHITGILAYCAYASYIPGLTGSPSGGSWTETTTGHASLVSLSTATSAINAFGPGTETFTYTSSAGCHSSVVVTINPIPHLSGHTSMCMGTSITLTPTVTGPGVPTWTIYPGTHATISGGVVTAPVTSGGPYVENISYSINGCVAFYTVTINPTPTINGLSDVCVGSSILESSSTGTTGGWSLSPTTPYASLSAAAGISVTVFGHVAGTVTLNFTPASLCAAPPKVITVHAANNAGVLSVTPHPLCVGPPGGTISLGGGDPGGHWTASCAGTIITGLHIEVPPFPGSLSSESCGLIYTVSSRYCPDALSFVGFEVDACGVHSHRDGREAEGDETGIVTTPELKVFPNPNQGTFTVNLLSDKDEPADVKITNMVGETINKFITTTNKVNEIKINDPAGIYLVTVTTAHGHYVAKVVAE